jgi:hypothetical protein
MRQVVGRAYARDFCRRVEQGGSQFARHHIGFVALRDRKQQVRVIQPGLLQHGGMRCIAAHGAHVQPVLQRVQAVGIGIDDGDVVGFRSQVFGDRRTDLPGAEDDNFQITISRIGAILCFATRRRHAGASISYGIIAG